MLLTSCNRAWTLQSASSDGDQGTCRLLSKEQQRTELHRAIWRIANKLRGSVDGWDFKFNVLGMLFYRYTSENLSTNVNQQEPEAGTLDFD